MRPRPTAPPGYHPVEPDTARLEPVSCVSFPRSGHTLLAWLLGELLADRFGYCEHYTPMATAGVPCCGRFPCTQTDRITMSKNHDFDLSSPLPDRPVIVQYRGFPEAVVSNFGLAVDAGREDSEANFLRFAKAEAARHKGFVEKWVNAPIPARLLIDYADLTAAPITIMGEVLDFMGVQDVPAAQIAGAVSRSPDLSGPQKAGRKLAGPGVKAKRKVTDFRYYDASLFAALGEAAGKLPPRRHPGGDPQGLARPSEGAPPAAAPRDDPGGSPARPDLRLQPNERFVFLHIPKCAGTSLNEIIGENFRKDEIFRHGGDVLPHMAGPEIRKYRFFTGHFTKYGIDAVPGPKRVVTVLREPQERILSLYWFWRSHKPALIEKLDLKGPRLARALSLEDFLRSDRPEVVGAINNSMVRVMLGPLRLDVAGGYRLSDRDFAVETALTNVKRFNYVAFAETLEEDVAEITSIFGFKPASSVPIAKRQDTIHEGSNKFEMVERETPSEEAWALLNSLTHLDTAFYRRAWTMRHTLRCPYPM